MKSRGPGLTAGWQRRAPLSRVTKFWVAAVATSVAMSLLSASVGAAPPPLQPIDPPTRIAVIGDSLIAGQGVSPQAQPIVPRCRRSTVSFPRLAMAELAASISPQDPSAVSLVDASCTGASTQHFRAQQTTYSGVNPPQADTIASGANIDYLMIGFGANDAGLYGVFHNCRNVYKVGLETCEQSMARNNRDPFAAIAASRADFASLLDDTRAVAPQAKRLVVGYAGITRRDADSSCEAVMGLSAVDMRYLDDLIAALNTMLQAEAIADGATFVDPRSEFLGHDGCAPTSERWIEPPSTTAALPTDHPNSAGHQRLTELVLAAIPDQPREYVSLGDSYTAGQGVDTQLSPNGLRCRQSTNGYPRLTERNIEAVTGSALADDLVTHKDASCSTASTEHTFTSQAVYGMTNGPQFDRLTANTTDVTIGFGANDARLLSTLGNCRSVYPSAETCAESFVRNNRDPYALNRAVDAKIGQVIDGVRLRSPIARIWVVGYPTIVPSTAEPSCEATVNIKAVDMPFFDAIVRDLNLELQTAAAAKGVAFVDTYGPSIGHDSCQPVGIRWIEPRPNPPVSALIPDHPNRLGQAAMAATLSNAILP